LQHKQKFLVIKKKEIQNMKTQILKTIRLMTFTLVLSVLTMHVWGYEKENNISGQGEGNKSEQTEKNAQKPQLEPWMVDGAFWKIKNNKNNTNRISSVFTEKREQLENWMLTEKNFKVIDPYLSEESLLERWMLNSNNFKTVEQIETDKIQKWMIEAENWNI